MSTRAQAEQLKAKGKLIECRLMIHLYLFHQTLICRFFYLCLSNIKLSVLTNKETKNMLVGTGIWL